MEKSYTLFVGRSYPHKGGTITIKDIVATVSSHFEGFTIQSGTGFWKGVQEKTVIVYVYAKEELVLKCIEDLKATFEQESVACQESQPLKFL